MNTSETKYYIGIDGGGTKTKFLVGRGLQVIGEYTAGGCHYMQIGFDGVETDRPGNTLRRRHAVRRGACAQSVAFARGP